MEFRVLGPLQVVVEGAPAVLRGAAERALLTRLLLDAGRVVPAERLIDDLWGEELPANALNALQGRVSRLRRALRGIGLAESLVVSRRPGYLLDVDRDAVDLHRFSRLLEEARRTAEHGGSAAGRQYAAALALWQGPALAEFDPEPWARDQRLRLEELRLAATEEWFEVRLAAGQHAELVGELTQLVARYPLRERLHGQLMIALYRSGRQAEALAAYQSARQTLDDELGLDPSPELRELEQAMLRQDAALAAPPRAPRAEPPALVMRLTSFVGRDRERLALRELLGSRRLVTLTGPGGVGKTSLALDVAAADQAPDGSWFVGLAGVADDEGLGPAVADAVGAPTGPGTALDRAIRHLHRRESLLVLDNCEHLTEGCATIADGLLTGCAGLRVLATSREPLGALDDHWETSAVAYHHGLALHRAGRLDAALGVHEAALAQGRMGLTNTVPYVLADMGHIALQLGDSDRAAQHFVEARDAARRLGAEGNAPASIGEGDLARERGDLAAATRHYRAALRLLAGQGAPESEAAALNGLGVVAARSADLDSAEDHHRAALRAAARSPASGARAAAAALEGLAQAAAGRGDAGRAANLLGTAARWRQWRHQPAGRTELQVIDRATTQARAALGDQAFDEAYARGLEPPAGTVVDLQQSAQQQLTAWLREPVVQQP